MEYKGAYDSSAEYAAGAVVVADDGIAYHAFKTPPTGTAPQNTYYWERLVQPLADTVTLFHSFLAGVKASTDASNAVIFDGNTLILGVEGSDDKYAITVDDSGDTPDLSVDEVTD